MKGRAFIVTAPSGAGKTSLIQEFLRRHPDIETTVSHTTRAPRGNDVSGITYHFVSRKRFECLIRAGEFLEYAVVHGHLYGTSRGELLSRLERGATVLFDVDFQGAEQLKRMFPEATTIFIVPPSLEELERRLRGRKEDSEESIQKRLKIGVIEMEQRHMFDHVVTNDIFEDCLKLLEWIVFT